VSVAQHEVVLDALFDPVGKVHVSCVELMSRNTISGHVRSNLEALAFVLVQDESTPSLD
jgi:hypothetical protein